ncbi:MAG: hypothetical protein K2H13_03790 [Eubacterium sp.]|nr:hypothetical protein [Eubacterium sp.]
MVTVDVTATGHAGAIGAEGKLRFENGKFVVKAGTSVGVGGSVEVNVDFSKLIYGDE